MDDTPKNLYKYLPPGRTSDVLGKLLIRFSQVSVMNDKEEFKRVVTVSVLLTVVFAHDIPAPDSGNRSE